MQEQRIRYCSILRLLNLLFVEFYYPNFKQYSEPKE